MARRFPRFKTFLALLVLAVVSVAARSFWLPVFAYMLEHDDGPAKADIAVVLAGEYYGYRMERAAGLVRAGYVPAVLVSGPVDMYEVAECDLAIPFAIRRGYPADWFIGFRNTALSTKEEAADILAELRRRNVHSFLLVTSNFHSARARRTYLGVEKGMGGGPPFRTVAAPDKYFSPDGWWRNREGQKTFFFEWSKTFAAALGM